VLTGKCPSCQTTYMADHERATNGDDEGTHSRVYINAAKYLKVGQSMWVDRIFSHGVVNGIYSFHASAAAYAEYWNNTFCLVNRKITRCQVWQAFVQESVRFIASASGTDLVLRDGLAIDEVTKQAFEILGGRGIIKTASQHSCSECTQKYRATTNAIGVNNPAAVVGMGEHQAVPPLIGINAMSSEQGAHGAQHLQSMIPENQKRDSDDDSVVTMAVLDGIVFGPSVCCGYFMKKAILTTLLALCNGKLYRRVGKFKRRDILCFSS
jgi:CxC5 like cysteine cluster associated with KDZ transposases